MINLPKKHLNLIQSGLSYLKSSVTGNPEVKGMPVSIGIELTNTCNLNCPECVTGSGQMERDKGYMSLELFNKVINELGPYLYNINLYFQGEPMLHPQFFSFLERSRRYHTTVSTNGHFLSLENSEKIVKSGLDHLIVSLDGMDQETYAAYRKNGKFNTVIEGIKNVAEAKAKFGSEVRLEIQFLVNRINEHQIPRLKEFAAIAKASLRLKSMQIINKKESSLWLPVRSRFRRYELKGGEYTIKSKLPDRCARLWFNPVITWDGKVLPCCFDKNGEHIMGDLNNDTFRYIWDGPKYRIFRKRILSGRHMIDICSNCTS
jgi:radical SAM protein with 4Fe4S-binding SPASM domain